LSTTNAQVAEW